MARFACPICGDPNAYPLWVDEKPPAGCPQDEAWHEGRPPQIRNVTECAYQMGRARQQAEWRKQFPDQFDENGRIKEGGLVHILQRLPAGTKLVI